MEETKKAGFKILSGNGLKLIAIITMLIDHVGGMIIEPGILLEHDIDTIINTPELVRWLQIDTVLRMIGRVAFPIFCYLLVEGFLHTRDVKKYALRLLAFCFVSEIPFNLGLSGNLLNPGYQNVFFTLFLGLLALIGLQKFQRSLWKQALVFVACCGTAMLLHTDYDAFGVFFIALLYLLRDNKKMQTLLGCIGVCWEITAPLAFIPINMYNGTRGKWKLKYLFYAFYPAHILVLWGIRMILLG